MSRHEQRPLKSGPVLGRKQESENHVAIVAGIRRQSVDPVVVANRIRITSQVAFVFHIDERRDDVLVKNDLALDDISQHVSARHGTAGETIDQLLPVRQCDSRVRGEAIDILRR